MPNFFQQLKSGHTKGQVKAREKRYQKRKAQVDDLQVQNENNYVQYTKLDDMLAVLNNGNGDQPPFLQKKTLIRTYILDWRRKQNHDRNGTGTTWDVFYGYDGVVHTIVWNLTTSNGKGGLTHGCKIYDMTKTTLDVALDSVLPGGE